MDVKQICYCLANALLKHIEFAQGFYFLDDLQHYLKATKGPDVSPSGKELEFTYDLGDNMKIDIEGIRQKKQEKEQQSKKEFEELKRKMDAAKLQEVVKPSPLVERSVKFSGGPKIDAIDP